MSDQFVGVDVSGIEEIVDALKDLPEEAQDQAVDEVNTYLLNVLRAYPPYRHVPFKRAYGAWFSEKQRKYVMARIHEGSITPGRPKRTQQFSQGWHQIGEGRNSILANETPYGPYLVGDNEQARMPKQIGWKKLGDTIKERMDQIMRRAEAGVKNAIKKLGL